MVTIENLKDYISAQEYQNLIEAVNLSFNNLENDRLQILNIYSSLMNKLQIEIDDFELITSNKEHFFRYYEAFELHAECIEKESVQDDRRSFFSSLCFSHRKLSLMSFWVCSHEGLADLHDGYPSGHHCF